MAQAIYQRATHRAGDRRVIWEQRLIMKTITFLFILTVAHCMQGCSSAFQLGQKTWKDPADNSGATLGRRQWIQEGLVSTAIVGSIIGPPSSVLARAGEVPSSPERDALLKAISSKSSDEIVLNCIDKLIATEPAKLSTLSLTDRINGEWKLIWSIKDDKFSPLLQLPPPLRPTSYQLAGAAAAPIVGEGRIAQLLTNGILGPTKTWLSSGVVEYKDPDILQIRPPFRLELETPWNRQTLVEAGSDADFRAVNVRSVDAQKAPPNLYQQFYLEDSGPGSLRISKIIEGDPVIVGATFVHMKL